ncbi:hypothetical protein ACX80J_15860 [Arthrobacter sp. MDB2-24]
MLHFPSKNSAAHTADPADVTRLHQLLGDHVWAFSNCRVDAPGLPVAEVDWIFYNSVKGTFILSEWKEFPARVLQVTDAGEPWVLANGSVVPNPVEQVARHLDAVRKVLRRDIRQQHFPSVDPLAINPYQTVYSPRIGPETRQERLRFGEVHGTLEELVRTVDGRYSPVPLVVITDAGKLLLAQALADLFRCSISGAVRKKISPPAVVAQPPQSRIAAIHRELAALHLELAALIDQGPAATREAQPPEPATQPLAGAAVVTPRPATPAQQTSLTNGHLRRHVVQHVPSSSAGPEHVRAAFLAALQDEQLRRSGLHVGLFGSLVGQRLEGNRDLASLALGSLVKWCLTQAAAAGIPAVKDPADPSIVRMTG